MGSTDVNGTTVVTVDDNHRSTAKDKFAFYIVGENEHNEIYYNTMMSQAGDILTEEHFSMRGSIVRLIDEVQDTINNPLRPFDFSQWTRCTTKTCPSLARWKNGSGDGEKTKSAKKKQTKKTTNTVSNASWIQRPEACRKCECDFNPRCLVSVGVFPPPGTKARVSPSSQVSSVNDELLFRKVLWIPSQIIKKHLDQAVLPYCQNNDQSSTEQLIKALDLFYRSLVPEMAIPSQAADSTTADCDVMFITLPPGIDNLGATCYLNSQLQCLSLNPVFREGVISWRKPIGRSNRSALADTNNMNAIITRLQKLLVMMHRGSHSVISAEKLAATIGINNDEMQDPTEFTGFLFDRMHEIFQESDLLKDLLPGIFQGSLEYVTECQKCHTRSVRLEPFMQLTLPIKGSKTKGSTSTTDVKSCLDSYLSTKEFLTGDNQYYCLLCKTKCDATREINLQKVPPVLNLQLSRYKFDLKTNTKRKTNDHVRLPNVIMIPSKNIVEGSCTNITSERRNSNNNNDSIFVQEEYMLCAVVSSW